MPVPQPAGLHTRSLLRDDVYLSLRNAIVDGTFLPGERLRDQELEAWLGVSRTPIREALLRLERAGLVLTHPGRSTIVAPHDPQATQNARQVVSALHELAARLGVPLAEAGDIAEMTEANTRFAAALDREDVDGALAADDAFHAVLVRASGNDMIAGMLEQATPVLRRVERMRFSSEAARASVEQHAAIVDEVVRGDADAAARLIGENWTSLDADIDGTDIDGPA